MTIRSLLFAALVALVGAVLWAAPALAHEATASNVAGNGVGETASYQGQDTGGEAQENGAPGDGERVEVQVWTVFAAGVAAALGLLGFLLRALMGWVRTPPPQDEAHH